MGEDKAAPIHEQLAQNVVLTGASLKRVINSEHVVGAPIELVQTYSQSVLALCAYFDSDFCSTHDRLAVRKMLKDATRAL